MSAACPICGAEAAESAKECPTCHLDVSLFSPVREAASLSRDSDPVYYRTIAELFRSVDLFGPAPELAAPEPIARVAVPELPPGEATLTAGAPAARAPSVPLLPMPPLPELPHGDALRSRAHEYQMLGAQAGEPMAELLERANAADESGNEAELKEAVREMFVHLSSALIGAYDAQGARRNELAARTPTPAADQELEAVRASMTSADLTGAFRHLARLREELTHLEEGWATERILLTECDLLIETIRELGGDPSPALGPLKEGRREAHDRPPEVTELLLAQTTYALWVLLEPRFTEELKRIRDRLVELRNGGHDVAPALAQLRSVATEIRRRNFAGTIVAYRHLRDLVGAPEAPSLGAEVTPERASRPA